MGHDIFQKYLSPGGGVDINGPIRERFVTNSVKQSTPAEWQVYEYG
jgi:hypothetical protein